MGKTTEIGDVLLGRLQALTRESWVPLSTILSAGADSPYYSETKRAGSLYNEGWALVHMLETTDEYRGKFWDVVNLIQTGASSIEALERVYGMPLARIENDLKLYIRGNSFKKLSAPIKLDDMEKLKADPAPAFDVRTLQADLLANHRESAANARARYLELTREDASRPEPWSGLAYLAWRESNLDDAVANFGKAYDAGDRSRRLLWDYGRLLSNRDNVRAIAVLDELLRQEPKNFEARVQLAGLQGNQRQYTAALSTIRGFSSVKTAADRDRVLFMRASLALQAGDRDDARARAEELKRLSTDQTLQSRADNLLRYLDETDRRGVQASAPPPQIAQAEIVEPAAGARPALSRREVVEATRQDMEIILQDVRGTLVEMDCGSPARMILETSEGKKAYLVLQPDRLIVTGAQPGQDQFNCGPQAKPPSLRLQFTIAPEGSGAAGVVRAVHFGN